MPSGTTALTCSTQSNWDDAADGGLGRPLTFYSFADFEAVLADCGTAQALNVADLAGNTFVNGTESTVFNNTPAAGTISDPETGTFSDTSTGEIIDFKWYVEAATCSGCTHNYLVKLSDSTIDADLPVGFTLRETSALTGLSGTLGVPGTAYTTHNYDEQSNYGDTDRATGTDGGIWIGTDTLQ